MIAATFHMLAYFGHRPIAGAAFISRVSSLRGKAGWA